MTHTTTDVEGEAVDDATAGDSTVDRAVTAFREGKPVLIHDAADREGETDIVYPAGAVDADAVAHLRQDAGGLICTAVSDAVADAVGLPFLEEQVDHPAAADHDLAAGEPPRDVHRHHRRRPRAHDHPTRGDGVDCDRRRRLRP